MADIEQASKNISIGCAAALLAGVAMQIGALYMGSAAQAKALSVIGQLGTFVGGAGLGIALPIYVLEKGKNDPTIYKKVLIATLVAVVAGGVLTGVNTGHSASRMIGQSLLTVSGGIALTVLFYYLIYGKQASSSVQQDQPQPHTTGGGQRLGRSRRRWPWSQAESRQSVREQRAQKLQDQTKTGSPNVDKPSFKDLMKKIFDKDSPITIPSKPNSFAKKSEEMQG